VIFGAAGDLAKRKLLPALYQLACDRRLPATFAIVGTSRTPLSDDDYRERMHEAVKQFREDGEMDEDLWKRFASNLHYVAGDVKDPQLYTALKDKVTQNGQGNVLFYLSTQPSYYEVIVDGIGHSHLATAPPGAWRRLIVEKPFGHDLESAKELKSRIHAVFREEDTYRIDHYLGKETVQNILALRFGNGM
jgi:glucose-6-phosphate 1-dehydrogenase